MSPSPRSIMWKIPTGIASIAFLAVLGCRDSTLPSTSPIIPPIQVPLANRIVFQSTRSDSLRDVWMMSSDGSDLRRLSDTTSRDACPALSPDGNWIAFHQLSRLLATTQTYPALQDSLVLMRADGSMRVALVQLERYAVYGTFCPRWSAGSDRLVTVSATEERRVRSNQNYRSRVLDRGGNVLATYDFGNLGVTLRGISLSPDGTRFLASVANNSTAGPPSGFRVYSMRIDGTDRVTIGDGIDGVWSPTGNSVAWNCFGVCVASSAGANVKVLYSESASGLPMTNNLSFSPNGSFVAFACALSGSSRRSLCFGDIATSVIEEIPISAQVGRISWMADNATVAFECAISGQEICVAKRGSGTFTNVTGHLSDDAEPSAR